MGRSYPNNIEITISGIDEARALLTKWLESTPQLVKDAVHDEMVDLMEESQKECPYDYTNDHTKDPNVPYHLRDTALVTQWCEPDDYRIVTTGSYDTPYAVYVHEILEYHHIPPTKAKFLEDVVNRREKEWLGNIMERVGDFYKEARPISQMQGGRFV
jgi:hypothetical protein